MKERKFDIVRTYVLFQTISQYPALVRHMRNMFRHVLVERKVLTEAELTRLVHEQMSRDGVDPDKANRVLYRDSLTDLFFATHLEPAEIDNYVNLVRKQDRCQHLGRVLNNEHSSFAEVYEALREFCDIPKGEIYISAEEAMGIRVSLIGRYISAQLPFIGVAKKYVTIRDINGILRRTIGSRGVPGRLGGKAAGMILGQKILLPTLEEKDELLLKYVRVPDTWYLSSGIFSEFIDQNELQFFHTQKYKNHDTIENEFHDVEEKFREASFSESVLERFKTLLEECGEHPLIIRSSSYLEDSFGLAFSGKYDSVFLHNQGDLETRMAKFIDAAKHVFASVYGPDPIRYRQDHGLIDYDERMAMIVQKVVGRRFGDYFFPFAAGVMFSYNSFGWSPKIDKKQGLVRLVLGLGTRAVERVGADYPRMIPLSHPNLRPEIEAQRIRKYSQKAFDALSLKTGALENVDITELAKEMQHPELFDAVSILKDDHLAAPMFKTDDLGSKQLCVTFDNLLNKTEFVKLVRRTLAFLEKAYGVPVDVEFAWDGGKLYILQCRSLYTREELENVEIPVDVEKEDIFFTAGEGLTNCIIRDIEYVVYIDPKKYDGLASAAEKQKVARLVSRLNWRLSEKKYALFGPGRWGSSDINLGVPVRYGDINHTVLLAEIAFAKDGITPEVSYGTHFFQDLVEADIAVLPLYPDATDSMLNETMIHNATNMISEIVPDAEKLSDVVRVVRVSDIKRGKYLHVYMSGDTQKGIGLLGGKSRKKKAK